MDASVKIKFIKINYVLLFFYIFLAEILRKAWLFQHPGVKHLKPLMVFTG